MILQLFGASALGLLTSAARRLISAEISKFSSGGGAHCSRPRDPGIPCIGVICDEPGTRVLRTGCRSLSRIRPAPANLLTNGLLKC